jgi:D-alanyl-D-alanine dipeptidase
MLIEARSHDQLSFSPAEIPVYKPMAGWKDLEITESGQPLASLNDLSVGHSIVISPQYYLNKIPNSLQVMYAREEVASRLLDAAAALPQKHSLVVFDAYRPIPVQESLFKRFKVRLTAENPNLDEESLSRLTQVYVSLPSHDPRRPSPHNTGGAY